MKALITRVQVELKPGSIKVVPIGQSARGTTFKLGSRVVRPEVPGAKISAHQIELAIRLAAGRPENDRPIEISLPNQGQ